MEERKDEWVDEGREEGWERGKEEVRDDWSMVGKDG